MRILALLFGLLTTTITHADTITILHTNDFHSRIEAINRFNSLCSVENNRAGKCFGGWARMKTAVEKARTASPNSLLFSGGDQFQGSLFYTYYKGKVAAEMMNDLGYDAMTAGNHEFDDGPKVLRDFIQNVNFPVLLSNANYMNEKLLVDRLLPSTTIKKNGHTYGLIGLTPKDLPDLASPGKNISMQDPIDAVKREIAAFKAKGINRIIVLSHSGISVDLAVAKAVNGIDLIVGGHSNTFLSNIQAKAQGKYPVWVTTPDGGRTAIVQAFAYGKYLGKIDLTFDENGVVTEAKGEPILVDGSFDEDLKIRQRVALLAKPLDEIRTKQVGFTDKPINGNRRDCRARECTMGNLVADAMLVRARPQGIKVAIINGGGLRASIDAGPVTMGEVLAVLPFQNTMATFDLKGEHIRTILETAVSRVAEGEGRFPQVAGMRFSFTLSKAPLTGRVLSIAINEGDEWVPLDDDAVYGVVTNDFLRKGGDGYKAFETEAQNPYDFGPNIEDVVVSYLQNVGDYTPALDGRIKQVK